MSKNKKSTIILAVLLLILGVVALMDKEISVLEYVCLYVNAVLYLGLVYSSDCLLETTDEFIELQHSLIRAQRGNIKMLYDALDELEEANVRLTNMTEVKYGKHDSTAAD